MENIKYRCVDCKISLSGGLSCDKCGRVYNVDGIVLEMLPKDMNGLAKEEARYHDLDLSDQTEAHQLGRWRNIFYHSLIWNKIKELPAWGRLLEIGAGNGFDAERLAEDYDLTLTDISSASLRRLGSKFKIQNSKFISCDGENLSFDDGQFDGVFMVATFHHFERPVKALGECARVLKNGGLLVLGVEPNSFYFKPIKFFQKILYKLTRTNPEEISKADRLMEGFSRGQFEILFSNGEWKDVQIRPMWLFAGLLHYTLEFIFRAFKLRKRIKLPLWLEKFVVGLDEALFHVPGAKYLCWHWIVSAKKID